MTQTLQDLRKEVGFKSARDFAEAMGIPAATYARYEQMPDKIPTKSAWALADKFGCSIDAVVGREHMDIESMRGDVQKFYDELGADCKSLFNEFCGFIARKEANAVVKRRQDDERKYDQLCQRFEAQFFAQLEEGMDFGDIVALGAPGETRLAFESFIRQKAEESGSTNAQNSQEVIANIMDAYDRAHGVMHTQGGRRIEYSVIDMRSR